MTFFITAIVYRRITFKCLSIILKAKLQNREETKSEEKVSERDRDEEKEKTEKIRKLLCKKFAFISPFVYVSVHGA